MMRIAVAALLFISPSLADMQMEAPKEFEAASVKPVPPGTPYGGMRGGPGTDSPGQLHYEAVTLRAVVARAYGIQRFQIAGPRWFDDERFDILAKIPPGTTSPGLQLMLQNLLASRFRLQLHKENRLSAAYEITVAKSGLRMRRAPPATTPVQPSSAAIPSGGMQWSSGGEKMQLTGHSVAMRQLTAWLSETTHREIVDKTDLKESYDFEVLWTPDSSTERSDPFAADILDSAIEKCLGLRVNAHRVSVEMLVIDRLERTPVEN